MKIEDEIVLRIKKRLDILVNSASKIRKMSDLFVCYDTDIVIELDKLKGLWEQDYDRRPTINGIRIQFINWKTLILIDEEKNNINLLDLDFDTIFSFDQYLSIMSPVSSYEVENHDISIKNETPII